MAEELNIIKSIRSLSDEDKARLLECLYCPFHTDCDNSTDDPIDNPDGTCKTKQEFKSKLTGLFWPGKEIKND